MYKKEFPKLCEIGKLFIEKGAPENVKTSFIIIISHIHKKYQPL